SGPGRASAGEDRRPSGALFLSEYFADLDEGAGFLQRLSPTERARLTARGTRLALDRGQGLFFQGDPHRGVWVIEEGRIRTFYVGHTGREMTLAYWTAGHFVGGPEVFGSGRHVWSADAAEDTALLFLPGAVLRALALEMPQVALAIIDGLVAKGKCYSALVQMLGTRSIAERLELLLRAMADSRGQPTAEGVVIDRSVTHEQFAMMVGATRQWVSVSLDRMSRDGLIRITRSQIVLLPPILAPRDSPAPDR
ncbi:MAG: Crp/Fnr family transcriptional regulator, partial [Pseudomonadota bacterium]